MKIGIYTFHAEVNFGAQLQAYATQRFLRNNGFYAEIVNIESLYQEKRMNYCYPWTNIKGFILNIMKLLRPSVRKKISNIKKFHSLMNCSRRYFSEDEYMNSPEHYDVHLVGSDQVWNVENGICAVPFYFLPFLPRNSVKISYASSFGCDCIKKEDYSKLKLLLSSFKTISVREKSGVDLVFQATGCRVKNVLDPTFLLSVEQWNSILPRDRIIPQKYILYYGFDKGANFYKMIREARRLVGGILVGVSVSLTSPYHFDRFEMCAGPLEFVRLIRDAEFVVTSSFHGMAMSIIFQKDFMILSHGNRMTRMESTLDTLGIKNRIVGNVDDVETVVKDKINYSVVGNNVKRKVNDSSSWLLGALRGVV